jgi:hypothetical protein
VSRVRANRMPGSMGGSWRRSRLWLPIMAALGKPRDLSPASPTSRSPRQLPTRPTSWFGVHDRSRNAAEPARPKPRLAAIRTALATSSCRSAALATIARRAFASRFASMASRSARPARLPCAVTRIPRPSSHATIAASAGQTERSRRRTLPRGANAMRRTSVDAR